MLVDVVVDTNIFLHAQNPNELRFQNANKFLTALLASSTQLCIDGVFDLKSPHLSLIAHEYLNHIPPGGLGYAVLVQLLQTGRVKMNVSTRIEPVKRRRIVSLIPHDSRDRTFVFVAANSEERVLVSHDFADYTPRVRQQIGRLVDVLIEEAKDTVARMRERESVEQSEDEQDVLEGQGAGVGEEQRSDAGAEGRS